MIQIVNWLLTRRCNLKCNYCAIVKNYPEMPRQYPQMGHYIKNEMTTDVVLNTLRSIKIHNPDAFHIFYGGEPLLRKDLPEIINYCNDNKIAYTIISNNTSQILPGIKRLFQETDYIEGFTSSVDPIVMSNEPYITQSSFDEITKSAEGLIRLKEFQKSDKVKDVVAEITVSNDNQKWLRELVIELSQHEIYSDITFIDIAKNDFYDFSNVGNPDYLVSPTLDLATLFNEMLDNDDLLIHMKEILLPKMFNTLPSKFNCGLEKNIHNITIDADGSMRLCLRIRGVVTPSVHVSKIFKPSNPKIISDELRQLIKIDKKNYCQGCNHSCLMMSQHIDTCGDKKGELVHKDKRQKEAI